MTGWEALGIEAGQYLFKVAVLGITMIAAVFAGAGIRKAVDKKKGKKDIEES